MNKYIAPNFHRVIGIDPDLDKNGFAFIEGETRAVTRLKFWRLFDELKAYKKSQLVYLEAGWLNKGNHHPNHRLGKAGIFEQGRRVGLNHGVGMMIEGMLKYLEIPYVLVRPTKSKMKQPFFGKLTGLTTKNAEEIDAYMLIHGLITKKQ